jgi:hypothetical protein
MLISGFRDALVADFKRFYSYMVQPPASITKPETKIIARIHCIEEFANVA